MTRDEHVAPPAPPQSPRTSSLRASRTALMVAAYRARAAEGAEPLCRDTWASSLAGEDGRAVAAQFDAAFPHMSLWIGVRTAFIDRQVSSLMASGAGQVVVLGAGLDTRAVRLARPGVRFFEVDQPASQELKRSRLATRAPEYPVEAAHYVPCDFEREDFGDRLLSAGFDPGVPAVFIWEGVTYYLSEAAVRATLGRIASLSEPSSVVIFDHFGKRMVQADRLEGQARATHDTLADIGEPVRFGTNNPLPMLREAGFRHIARVSFEEACLSLQGSYDRARAFRFQWLVQASAARSFY